MSPRDGLREEIARSTAFRILLVAAFGVFVTHTCRIAGLMWPRIPESMNRPGIAGDMVAQVLSVFGRVYRFGGRCALPESPSPWVGGRTGEDKRHAA